MNEKTNQKNLQEFMNEFGKGVKAFGEKTVEIVVGGAVLVSPIVPAVVSSVSNTSCKNGTTDTPTPPPEPDPVCECPDTEHLGIGETCDCGLADCDCTLKVYGQIDDNTRGNHFKIYRNGDITDAEMATAVTNVTAAYNTMSDAGKNGLSGKIDEVHVIADEIYSYKNVNGKLIFSLKFDHSDTIMQNLLNLVSNGTFTPVIAQVKSDAVIRLANGKTTSVGEVIALGKKLDTSKEAV